MANSRRQVLQLLRAWDGSQRHAQDLLNEALEGRPWPPKERTLIQHLFFGVLRHRRLLDLWVDHLRNEPPSKEPHGRGRRPVVTPLDEDTRRLLQLGLFQLFHTRIPDHAALNETLRLAPSRARGLLNAILRRATRERDVLQKLAAETSPAIRYSLPDFLFSKWEAAFGPEAAEALGEWCQQPAPTSLRRNDLLPQARALLQDHGLEPVPGLKRDDFYRLESVPLDLIEAGAGYVQDPATVLACDLLDVQPGHDVLDVCAAPGGKTAYMAQVMRNQGTLVATDSLEGRRERLQENLNRLGVTCAEVKACDWKTRHPQLGTFDRILIDVPCSNTGVLRRRLDLRWRLGPSTFTEMAELQTLIASNALRLLRVGGRAVYSTCSIEAEENEAVVARLLELDSGLERKKVRRSLPHRDGFDGAFAALLVRKGPVG